MRDYHFIITSAVSSFPSTADEARHAIYEQARTALHERLGNDPQISKHLTSVAIKPQTAKPSGCETDGFALSPIRTAFLGGSRWDAEPSSHTSAQRRGTLSPTTEE